MSNPDYEQRVREAWEDVRETRSRSPFRFPVEIYEGGLPFFRCISWQAAWEFTEARREEVRRIEEEIGELEREASRMRYGIASSPGEYYHAQRLCRYGRTLQRLLAIRDELTRGMKTPAGAGKEGL